MENKEVQEAQQELTRIELFTKALQMQGFIIDEQSAEQALLTIERVDSLKEKFSLKDSVDIVCAMEKKYEYRKAEIEKSQSDYLQNLHKEMGYISADVGFAENLPDFLRVVHYLGYTYDADLCVWKHKKYSNATTAELYKKYSYRFAGETKKTIAGITKEGLIKIYKQADKYCRANQRNSIYNVEILSDGNLVLTTKPLNRGMTEHKTEVVSLEELSQDWDAIIKENEQKGEHIAEAKEQTEQEERELYEALNKKYGEG